MSKIIVPSIVPPAYDLVLTINFNTQTGATELQVKATGLKQINHWQLAGILSEHVTSIIRQIISGKLKVEPING